jgi:hypothetical protein
MRKLLFIDLSDRADILLTGTYLLFPLTLWVLNTNAFITEDSFFYLVTARNIALSGSQTFSGIYPTNGVHPLWLYLLAGYSWLVSLLSEDLLYKTGYAVPLSFALLVMSALNFRRVALTLGFNVALFVLPPVCYLTAFSVLYSEAHASYFALSLLARLAVERSWEKKGGTVLIGIAVALVFLGRLDSVFFVGAYYIWYFFSERRFSRVFISGLVSLSIAVTYMASNLIFFGGLMPVSGWLKSTFPHFHLGKPLIFQARVIGVFGYSGIFGVIPIALSILTILMLWKKLRGARTILYAFSAGSLFHFGYIAFFTKEYTLWPWYYVLPVVLGTLAFSLLMQEFRFWKHLPRMAAIAAVVMFTAFIFHAKTRFGLEKNLWPTAWETLRYIGEKGWQNKVIMVSENPGTIAFYTKNHIIASDMLTSNRLMFDNMVESENALEFLAKLCRESGKPIDYFIWNGGDWLVFSEDYRTLSYIDPKQYPNRVTIGELKMGDPVYISDKVTLPNTYQQVVVWEADQTKPPFTENQ